MRLLTELYRKLDLLQTRASVRIALSVVAGLACVIVFGWLIMLTHSLDGKRQNLRRILSVENYVEGDAYAVALHDTGMIDVGNTTYGEAGWAEFAPNWFDGEGRVIDVDGVVELLLRGHRPALSIGDSRIVVPTWLVERPATTWLLACVVTAWLALVIWMGLTVPFLITLLATAIPIVLGVLMDALGDVLPREGVIGNLLPWFLTGPRFRIFVIGLGLLVFTFVLLSRVLQSLYNRPYQPLAVAHTVLKEAGRLRITLVFLVTLLVLLPLLPVSLDTEAPLRFQVQTFISRSLGMTYALAACFTLFLACATVAFEIRDRQIWQIVTKPVGRFNYLIGKWLGVVSLNLVILVLSGVSTFLFVQYLREQPVAGGAVGEQDRAQLETAVLTARRGKTPVYERMAAEKIRERVDQIIRNDPELAGTDVSDHRRRQIANEIRMQFDTAIRSIPPGAGRTYEFTGLEGAESLQSAITVRYRFHILADDEHQTFPCVFQFNEDQSTRIQQTYVPTMSHVLTVPSNLVKDGRLKVTIYNLYEPPPGDQRGSLNFDADDLEVLYKVSSFESNFLRAMIGTWVKLAFLAMLGIACATFLSFPVACLMSFTIFISATLGPYLAMSLEEYYVVPFQFVDRGDIGMVVKWAFRSFIKVIAQGLSSCWSRSAICARRSIWWRDA